MEHKIRTTIYLDKEVKRLVDEDNLNLSKWVSENLLIALCVESESDLVEKKSDMEGKIKVLDERLLKMRESKKTSGAEESAKKQVLGELRSFYAERTKKGLSRTENLSWITSPKNIVRCKLLGFTPEEALNGLEAWYDGTQTSK